MKGFLFTLLMPLIICCYGYAQPTICLGEETGICVGDEVLINMCSLSGTDTNIVNVPSLNYLNLADDQYSNLIPLGFDFEFYGNTFNECLISSNGYITFDLTNAEQFSPWQITAAAPSNTIPTNSIMLPWQDYDPSLGGIVGYTVLGNAPNRRFVVLFKDVFLFDSPLAGCSGVVLYEGSNKIEIFLDEKPIIGWNQGAAIQGIQNEDGTIAHIVPGRNFPNQWTANLDGRAWLPNGPNDYVQVEIPYKAYVLNDGSSLTWGDTQGNVYDNQSDEFLFIANSSHIFEPIGVFLNYSSCAVNEQLTSDTAWVFVGDVFVTATATHDICTSALGSAFAEASGGGGVYLFEWDDAMAQTTNIASDLDAGIYTVTVTDQYGCSAEDTVQINLIDFVYPSIEPSITEGCIPVDVQFLNTTDAPTASFSIWEFGEGTIDTVNVLGSTFNSYPEPGVYDVSLRVITNEGCEYVTYFDSLITAHGLPVADFSLSPSRASWLSPNFTANGGISIDAAKYNWYVEDGSPSSGSDQLFNFTMPNEAGWYDLYLTVENEFGCQDERMRRIQVFEETILYAPNTFTPNGDEHNERWKLHIQGIDVYSFHLQILNRWGKIVFESFDPEGEWDGTYGGAYLKSDTYIWLLEVKEKESSKKLEFNGVINLLR